MLPLHGTFGVLPAPQDVAVIVVVGVALCTDLRSCRVPNLLTFPAMGLSLVIALEAGHPGDALAGIGLALVLMLPGWLLGGAIRAGDAKLLMAVGGFWGPALAFRACVLTYVISFPAAVAVLIWKGRFNLKSIWQSIRNREGPRTRVPWVPVVALAVWVARLSVAS